jgi:hypothetical protein
MKEFIKNRLREGLVDNPIYSKEIKSEKYWRQVLSSKYALDILNTIMQKQNGWASERQYAILNRERNGDKTPYSTKN